MENNDRIMLQEIFNSCAQMYAFLARLYRVEIDEPLLNELIKTDYAAIADVPEVSTGYQRIDAYLKNLGEDPINDLAVDYARTFLGYGATAGKGAFPYESVYTSREGLIMQEARDEVVALYSSENMIRDESFNEPEDHIAFTLAYLEHLSYKLVESLQIEDEVMFEQYLSKKLHFLQDHMLNWVPRFCIDVEKISDTDFYKGLAQITEGYLKMGVELIEEIRSI